MSANSKCPRALKVLFICTLHASASTLHTSASTPPPPLEHVTTTAPDNKPPALPF